MARMSNLLEEVKSIEEGFASDAQRRAAFASGYKEKGKKKKEEEAVSPAQQAAIAISKKEKAKKEGIELDEYLTADEKKLIAKMYDKKGNLTSLGKKVMDYKIKKEEIEENTLDIENESDYTLDEGKMKELHGYISSGKSAEQIAKIMKLDVKTIKALMKEETDIDELSLSVKDVQKSGVRKQDTSKLKKDLERLKKGLKKEDTELDESMEDEFGEKFQSRRPSSKDVKMAIGIASDPRYAKGNMTGAVKAIEKIRDGLSDHPQVAAVLKRQNEDVKVIEGYFDEQKSSTGYDLYHKDFSGAMQHAYAHAKKKFGITIDNDEIDDKVASGPRKPSKGKTNSYRLKGDKGAVQIQVYNMGSRFELNMYKEEVDLDELTIADVRKATEKAKKRQEKERKTTGKTSISTADLAARRKNKKEEVEIDEASMKIGSIDFELFSSEKGSKAANMAMNKEIARASQMKDYKTARAYMDKVQKKYSELGAEDSEPERTIDAVLKRSFKEEVEIDEGKTKPVSQMTPKEKAADAARRKEYKDYQKSKRGEEVEIDEKAPKIGVDRLKQQRDKDKAHSDAMGRHVKSGRRKSTKEEVELDEVSKEGTMRVIDLVRQNNPEVRKHLNVANAGNKGYQVQRMTKGKFVNQGKPYSKLKDAQKVQQGGQHSMQFETIDESVKYGGIPAGLSKERIKADRDVYAQVLGIKEAIDPADFDISATSKDVEKADQNIMIQLQKVITLRGQKPVEFADGKKEKVHPNVASAALSMHRKLRRTDEKDAFQRKIGKSYRDLLNAVKGK